MQESAMNIILVALGVLATNPVMLPAVWKKSESMRKTSSRDEWKSATKLGVAVIAPIIFIVYIFTVTDVLRHVTGMSFLVVLFNHIQTILLGLLMLFAIVAAVIVIREQRNDQTWHPTLSAEKKLVVIYGSLYFCVASIFYSLSTMLSSIRLTFGLERITSAKHLEIIQLASGVYVSVIFFIVALAMFASIHLLSLVEYDNKTQEVE